MDPAPALPRLPAPLRHVSVLQGSHYPTNALRRGIYAPVLIQMLQTAAISGCMPQMDPDTGTEIGPARQLKVEAQLDCAFKLLDKVLPSAKEEAAPYINPSREENLVEVTPDRVRTMTSEQLDHELRARFSRAPVPTSIPASPVFDSQPLEAWVDTEGDDE